ncbi:hypothetical protein [Nakamurella aerolata]|uniref:Uncharacterized protein n=1 Tax=Nakamurella aerolata TaxID=1656892 RepID=A0A849A516_9ACTN|nr:hypothetical protein [Nakamurella aerolata]NNG36084.1 hypothetical protein [Nakamurella aerolata]
MSQPPLPAPTNAALIPAAPWLIPGVAPQLQAEQPELVAAVVEAARWLLQRSSVVELLIATAGGVTAGGVLHPSELPDPRWQRHPYGRAGRHNDSDADSDALDPADPAAAGWWVGRAVLAGAAGSAGTASPADAVPASVGLLLLADGALSHPGGPLAPAPEQRREVVAASADAERRERHWQADALAGRSERRQPASHRADPTGASLPMALRAMADRQEDGQKWCGAGRFFGAPYGVGYHVYRWWR